MKLFIRTCACIFGALLYTTSTYAAEGVVAHIEDSCDFYIANTKKGFSLHEHFSGREPNIGEVIVGDYEHYGMKTIYNLSSHNEYRAWIEDYWLTQDQVIEMYIDKCY